MRHYLQTERHKMIYKHERSDNVNKKYDMKDIQSFSNIK